MARCLTPIRAASCALAAFALSLPAAAQTTPGSAPGLYVFGALGVNMPRDSQFDTPGVSTDVDLNTALTGAAGLGYAFGNGFRTEFELAHRRNSVDSAGAASGNGRLRSNAFMFNALYDFNIAGPWTPFIGAGVGGARVKSDSVRPIAGTVVDDRDTAFAWQATAGVSYAMSQRMDLTMAYRYFSVPWVDYRTQSGLAVDSDYSTHELLVGVRFRFGAPPPSPAPVPAVQPAAEPAPPPPAPAPAPAPRVEPAPPPVARDFIVFFDFDSAELTPQAREILRTAAENARKVGTTRIQLTGHTDRAGPASYNQRLSVRRGESARAELQRLGIPAGDISVIGRGEEQPLVPT
jgi:OmpA-OmpF porin, OOP family